MKPTPVALLLALTSALCAATVAHGEAEADSLVFRVAPEDVRVEFLLGATLHKVEGSFRTSSVELRFDPADGRVAGRIVVDASSGETGNAKRDRQMHEKVLESAAHPRFEFTPERLAPAIAASGSGEARLRGVLKVRGEEHPIEVPISYRREGGRLYVEGSFEVPYVEWGMNDPSRFVLRVEKRVRVTVRLHGVPEPAEN